MLVFCLVSLVLNLIGAGVGLGRLGEEKTGKFGLLDMFLPLIFSIWLGFIIYNELLKVL